MVERLQSDKKREDEDTTVIGNLVAEKTAYVQNNHMSNEKLFKLREELEQLSQQRAKCTQASTGGYAAEVHHKYTFEADALKKGYKDIQVDLGPRGGYGSKGTADLKIVESGKTVGEAGLKYMDKANKTVYSQSTVSDTGRQKICPSDQVEKVKELSSERASTGTLKANEYADTTKNATDRLKYKDIESKPLSKAESMEIVSDASKYSKQAFQNDLKISTKSGALGGAVASGAISVISNTVACANGEKQVGEAVFDVAKDTTIGTVKGAAIGAGSQVVKQTLVKAGARSLAKGSVPIVIAATALDAGLGIVSEAKKMIDGEQDMADFAANSVVYTAAAAAKGGTAYAGAELGATLGVIGGPVGVVVGGVIGGTVGFIVGDFVVDGVKNFFCW